MSEKAKKTVLDHAQAGNELREHFFQTNAEKIVEISRRIAAGLTRGNKILFCGNGGSASDAQHLAAEFVNRFLIERPPLPAIALTTDTSILTAIGNDYGFDQVFLKQVQALGYEGDFLFGISTSGNSANLISPFRWARENGIITIGLLGNNGGDMLPHCSIPLIVESNSTPLIQEVHITVGHLICQLVDHFLFEAVSELEPYLQHNKD